MKEGGLCHRLHIARADIRLYGRHRRHTALARSLWWTFIRRHWSELCQECGRPNRPACWCAPDPLWLQVMPNSGGVVCPECFDRKLSESGVRVTWVPMVVRRDGQATTNWWADETRDWLLCGQPDPGHFPNELVRQPQPTWAIVRDALIDAGHDMPPIDYYPTENKVPS